MNIDINKMYAAFPMEAYRDGQQEALKFVADSINAGKRFIILEMPTGAGKSPIAVAAARSFESAYYITASKQLQDQLSADFGDNGKYGSYIVPLKGRNAYECTFRKRKALESLEQKKISKAKAAQWQNKYFSCDAGKCRDIGMHRFKECVEENLCEYYVQVAKAQAAQTVNMNFSSFLYQTCFTDRFGKRDIMVIDEAHQIESQLMGFVSLTLTNKDIALTIPEFETPEDYAKWMIKIDIAAMLDVEMAKRLEAGETQIYDKLKATQKKCDFFITTMSEENHDSWVCEYDNSGRITKVEFKPVYVHKYAQDYIFSQADIIVMMSATILNVNVFIKSLGISKELMTAKRMASRFPAENHPIYYKPVVKVTGGNDQKKRWGPPIIKEVNRIVKSHKDQRGIIHTHNFAISRLLMEGCSKDTSKRFLFQENFKTKAEMLEFHAGSTNTVIVAPAMHEGVDLYDDLCYDYETEILTEFGFIPFPNLIEGIRVAAFSTVDESIKFEMPSRITNTIANEWVEFDTNTNNLLVTASHRMLWRNSTTSKLIETTAINAPQNKHHQFVCAGTLDSPEFLLSDSMLCLAAAYQADGSWISGINEVRFMFRRTRKIERMREILATLKIPFRTLTNKHKDTIFLIDKSYFAPLLFLGKWWEDKTWDLSGLLKLSPRQRLLLLDELQYWDGTNNHTKYFDTISYVSAIQSNIDTIQAVAALSGRRSSYNGCRVYYSNTPYATFVAGEHNYIIKSHKINMPAYCVTVSTGYVVVRRRGKVVVSGNSRFQIICKVPFPNFYEDKQLAARMKDDDLIYNWLVALKLAQSAGRSVRSETDHAKTYIIDESFGWWFNQNEILLPKWFKDGLKVGKLK